MGDNFNYHLVNLKFRRPPVFKRLLMLVEGGLTSASSLVSTETIVHSSSDLFSNGSTRSEPPKPLKT